MTRPAPALLLLGVALVVSGARAEGAAPGSPEAVASDSHEALRFHPAVSGGIGLAHDVIGLAFELRAEHFGASVGVGLPLAVGLSLGGTASLMGSLRYFREGAAGLVFALNGGYLLGFADLFGSKDVRAFALSATAAWRWNRAGWFAEAGAGPALLLIRDRAHGLEGSPGIDLHLVGGYEF